VLHSDIVAEPELRSVLGDGVALYANRVHYPPEVTLENLARAEAALEGCVANLMAVRPHVVVWACTSGSVHAGPQAHAELLQRLASWVPGAVAVTAASAVIGALQAAGARRVAVLTPYPPDVNERLASVLADAGIAVTATTRMFDEPVDDWTLQAEGPERMRARSAQADRPDADALLVSCTGIAGATIVPALERELGKPVITSNLAIAHAIRSALGGAA
jgi:maleate isomerase